MEQVGRILSHISAVRNLAVNIFLMLSWVKIISRLIYTPQIVITPRLAGTMVKEDDSPGTFDQGARGILMPQLGVSCLALPYHLGVSF